MNFSLGLLGRLALVAFGYCVAVLVSVSVAEALLLAPSALPDGAKWGSIQANLRDLPVMFWGGLLFTFIFALPGFLIAVGLSLRRRWDRWPQFAVAGAGDALFALGLMGAYNGNIFGTMSVELVVTCLPGGFAGGAAYFAAAGRFLVPKS